MTDAPHFAAGMTGELNGIRWRVTTGRKGQGDLVLWVCSSEWRMVPMALGFLLADFFTDNEGRIHSLAVGRRGGGKYLAELEHAAWRGWRVPTGYLEAERKAARREP